MVGFKKHYKVGVGGRTSKGIILKVNLGRKGGGGKGPAHTEW